MAKPKRKQTVQQPRPRADLGASGPAMQARPSTVVETVEAGVLIRWMEDTGPIAHYRRTGLLLDRQCDALARLAELYEESGRRAATSAGYGGRVNAYGEMSDAQAYAWRDYCRLLDRAPPDTRHALALVADGEFPRISCGLQLLRRGAEALAIHLRYDY
ncbi:hypothetical protein [Roseomonas xinghualingensis]|uniref:hypothetical protein n=1 Tax=Roseomonas xinghualingensis TaxID=2986475 RepID=UPI0021F0BA2A|nr:hypothetical protein [Roseomonas sp. SXEYE001]MCV4209885.1 hypothetical protein [Roseomonas sp. SXEYE001]